MDSLDLVPRRGITIAFHKSLGGSQREAVHHRNVPQIIGEPEFGGRWASGRHARWSWRRRWVLEARLPPSLSHLAPFPIIRCPRTIDAPGVRGACPDVGEFALFSTPVVVGAPSRMKFVANRDHVGRNVLQERAQCRWHWRRRRARRERWQGRRRRGGRIVCAKLKLAFNGAFLRLPVVLASLVHGRRGVVNHERHLTKRPIVRAAVSGAPPHCRLTTA